jgi:3-oxoadipate enol-lactonase
MRSDAREHEEKSMKARIRDIGFKYEIVGPATAPAVVLHHPLATNLGTWDALTAQLTPHYRVLRFDARGHGRSDAPTGAYDLEGLAADVIGLMDHAGIDRAHFLGLSMGGMIGQVLGIAHASRFHSLTLVSTSSRVPPEARQIWLDRIANAPKTGMAGTVETALGRWLTAANRADRPDLVARLTGMMLSTPVDGYIGWCHAISKLNLTDRLSAIRLPTLVVVGADDPATTPAAAEVIHKGIAGSKLIVMPGVSHMLQEEDPAAFHAHVLPFLAAHTPA